MRNYGPVTCYVCLLPFEIELHLIADWLSRLSELEEPGGCLRAFR
jgi:hypothetical protein